jgi:poly(glycerol-phosphate) alpha-glucosyltransferase
VHVANTVFTLSDYWGGPPNSVRGLSEAVAQRGVQVSYFTTVSPGERANVDGVQEAFLGTTGFPASWYYSKRFRVHLEKNITRIDLLHIHEVWGYPQYISAKVALQRDVPFIVCPRGSLEPWRVRSTPGKYAKKWVYMRSVGRDLLRRPACFHALAPAEAKGIRRAGYRGPIVVIPNGVDVDRFNQLPHPDDADREWGALKGRRVALFLSRLSAEKGLDLLIPAWADICGEASYGDVMLVLTGPDDRGYGRVVDRLIEQHGVGKHVLRTGPAYDLDKDRLISRADAFVLPSYSEGFSVAVLENMAAGKPVLITPGCNFPQVAERGAGLCVVPDRAAIREGLRRLLDMSPPERQEMGQLGRNLVRDSYSWSAVAEKMIAVYSAVIHGSELPGEVL